MLVRLSSGIRAIAIRFWPSSVSEFGTALAYAERLARAMPGDPGLSALIESLRRQINKPDAR